MKAMYAILLLLYGISLCVSCRTAPNATVHAQTIETLKSVVIPEVIITSAPMHDIAEWMTETIRSHSQSTQIVSVKYKGLRPPRYEGPFITFHTNNISAFALMEVIAQQGRLNVWIKGNTAWFKHYAP